MIRYHVQVSQFSNGLQNHFIQWMREEHMQDMLGVKGCKECRVFCEQDGSISCEYLFSSQEDLDAYIQNGAKIMREKGLKKFAGASLEFLRTTQELVLEGRHLEPGSTS